MVTCKWLTTLNITTPMSSMALIRIPNRGRWAHFNVKLHFSHAMPLNIAFLFEKSLFTSYISALGNGIYRWRIPLKSPLKLIASNFHLRFKIHIHRIISRVTESVSVFRKCSRSPICYDPARKGILPLWADFEVWAFLNECPTTSGCPQSPSEYDPTQRVFLT